MQRRPVLVRQWRRLRRQRQRQARRLLWRLQRERTTRAAGRFYGTQATAYGAVARGPQPPDPGRVLLALVVLAPLLLLSALVLDALGGRVQQIIRAPPPAHARLVWVVVRPGETIERLAPVLQRDGLIDHARLFVTYWYLRPEAVGAHVQPVPGSHRLRTDMSVPQLVQALTMPPAPHPSGGRRPHVVLLSTH
jgi:hypothetical protein